MLVDQTNLPNADAALSFRLVNLYSQLFGALDDDCPKVTRFIGASTLPGQADWLRRIMFHQEIVNLFFPDGLPFELPGQLLLLLTAVLKEPRFHQID
jgi:hypothetical protein